MGTVLAAQTSELFTPTAAAHRESRMHQDVIPITSPPRSPPPSTEETGSNKTSSTPVSSSEDRTATSNSLTSSVSGTLGNSSPSLLQPDGEVGEGSKIVHMSISQRHPVQQPCSPTPPSPPPPLATSPVSLPITPHSKLFATPPSYPFAPASPLCSYPSPRRSTVAIDAPERVVFEMCCVGAVQSSQLSLKNRSERWLQCNLELQQVTRDGREVRKRYTGTYMYASTPHLILLSVEGERI